MFASRRAWRRDDTALQAVSGSLIAWHSSFATILSMQLRIWERTTKSPSESFFFLWPIGMTVKQSSCTSAIWCQQELKEDLVVFAPNLLSKLQPQRHSNCPDLTCSTASVAMSLRPHNTLQPPKRQTAIHLENHLYSLSTFTSGCYPLQWGHWRQRRFGSRFRKECATLPRC